MGILWGVVAVGAGVLALVFLRKKTYESNGEVSVNRVGDGLKRLKANKEKYAVMTRALLEATPDEALLEAVLSNLWAKMKPDMSDASEVMRGQTPGRQALYALYAVTGGIRQEGLAAVRNGPDSECLPACEAALMEIEAYATAEILRKAMREGVSSAYDDAYLESFDAEHGKDKMIAYVRKNAGDFVDLP